MDKKSILEQKNKVITDYIKSVTLWNSDNYTNFIELLKANADNVYKAFHINLILMDNVLGYQVPLLRSFAKTICKGDYKSFLDVCGYDYYEEHMLFGLVILNIKEPIEEKIKSLERYLPRIDNWCLSDVICCDLKNNTEIYYNYLLKSLDSDNEWIIRFSITALMVNFLKSDKINEIVDKILQVKKDVYYINMAIAWFLATLYTVNNNLVVEILQKRIKNAVILKMTLRKISDSHRVSKEEKINLKIVFKC